MKRKVKLSNYSIIMSTGTILFLIVAIIVSLGNSTKVITLSVLLGLLLIPSLYYFPVSIEADSSVLKIHSLFKTKTIPYAEIAKADRCYPSAGGIRLCGRGGFMGYWGYFHDLIIGYYFGYYGKFSECILIRLKNGKQYVISCEQPDAMLEEITSHLH